MNFKARLHLDSTGNETVAVWDLFNPEQMKASKLIGMLTRNTDAMAIALTELVKIKFVGDVSTLSAEEVAKIADSITVEDIFDFMGHATKIKEVTNG